MRFVMEGSRREVEEGEEDDDDGDDDDEDDEEEAEEAREHWRRTAINKSRRPGSTEIMSVKVSNGNG